MASKKHHGVKHLVVSCIDYRFRDKIARWIRTNLKNQADLVSVGGASKAFNDTASVAYLMSHLALARDLHGVTTIHLIDHIDCGAYGGSKQHANETAEKKFHRTELDRAAKAIKKKFPKLKVKKYIATFKGVQALS